jgi:sugar O-acyltransferase (sialic acid O-acetyltransferase NeuD family)
MAQIVIFGTGEIAQLAHYYFSTDSDHTVAAFTVDREYLHETVFKGLPVIAFEEVISRFPPPQYKMFIAISYAMVNKVRAEKYLQAKEKGYELVSYISSRATVFDNVEIGDNCFILEDNTVQPFATIGNNVTLWSGNHIGHHSAIGDHCFISSHVVISGGVMVEPYCFIGVNATLRDHITIARETVIGAACLLLKGTKEREVYIGTAAEPRIITSDRLKGI